MKLIRFLIKLKIATDYILNTVRSCTWYFYNKYQIIGVGCIKDGRVLIREDGKTYVLPVVISRRNKLKYGGAKIKVDDCTAVPYYPGSIDGLTPAQLGHGSVLVTDCHGHGYSYVADDKIQI